MRSEVFTAMVLVAGSVVAVRYIDRTVVAAPQEETETAFVAREETRARISSDAYRSAWSYEVRVPAGYDRQFRVTGVVNRQPTGFLIDTGASFVALRESDARRAGIYPKAQDYTAPVSTANGITKAARVEIDEIEIDGLIVRNIETFVLPDAQLGMNLLGMSFLSRLESVEARGDEMILRG